MREHLVNLALKLVGCPYIWGGANPWTGFDCSGFIIWIYQVFGLLPSGDWTAEELYRGHSLCIRKSGHSVLPGDLVAYGEKGGRIIHVMLALGNNLVVGASGGDHTTTTEEAARRRGAQVKVKPLEYRQDFVGILPLQFPGE